MRPVSLEFQGLRSYRQTTTIDFSDLDLFAIIGDTGAGKSTVIEALSLALYGRKTWTGGSNLDELIADGENTMAISLVFLADGNEWTVTRSRHRNSSAPINKLECAATGEKVDGNKLVNERIEDLLGLDHSQFVRAVVLPQGRFDELLQSTRTDRNKILRSIFGLDDLRRVREDVGRRSDSWKPVIVEAAARRDALPPDPVAALEATKRATHDAARRQTELAATVAELSTVQTSTNELDRKVAQVEHVGSGFAIDRQILEPLAQLSERAAALNEQRAELLRQQAEAEAGRDSALAGQAQMLHGFEHGQAARAAVGLVRSVAANLRDLASDATSATGEINTLVAAPPLAAEPQAITDDVQSSTEALTAAQEADAAARSSLDQARTAWESLAAVGVAVDSSRSALTQAQERADAARTEAAVAGAAVTAAALALDQARSLQAEAQRGSAAIVAAHGLTDGDACPVCAQALPPGFAPPQVPDLDRATAATEAADTDLAAARREATSSETAATMHAETLQTARTALDAALVRVGEARAAAVALSLDPDAPDTETALGESQRAVAQTGDALTSAKAVAAKAEQARLEHAAQRSAASAAYERDLAAARQRLAHIETRVNAQHRQLADLPEAWRPATLDPDTLDAQATDIEAMVASLESLVETVKSCENQLTASKQRFSELRAEAIENVNTPANEIARQLNEQVAIATALVPLVFEPEAAPAVPAGIETPVLLEHVPELPALATSLVGALEPVAAQRDAARTEWTEAQGASQRRIEALLAAAGVDSTASLHSQAGAAEADAKRAEADTAALEAQVAKAKALDAVLDTGRPYLANLELLGMSLRDQHFVDHLVSAREVELLAEATRRLKAISNGRYGFVPDFGVVRIASGEVRSPDTLSGGERFQAALALALALVEIASRGAGKLDAVFVDEGFGSLDGAALDVALDTLGSVAGGGKLVALISHLHPVAEYVDTVFNVTKDDLFGSTIAKLDAEAREALLDDRTRSGLTQ